MGADPYGGIEVVSRHGSADGLQMEQPGLQPVEKNGQHQPMYNMQMMDSYEPKAKRIFGVRRPTFLLSLALAAAILAAIGIGAGLGVSRMHQARELHILANNQQLGESQSCNSSTAIPANSTVVLKPTTDCPDSNGQFVTMDGGDQYQKFCNSTLGGWYDEVTNAIVDNFNNCIRMCANINYNLNRTDISAMYNAYGSLQVAPGYCLCASSQQKGHDQVDSDSETDLAILPTTS